jgi:hypothetical protein
MGGILLEEVARMIEVDFDAVGNLTPPERALLIAVNELQGEGSFDSLLKVIRDRDPKMTTEEVRGAVWSLARRGVLQVTWEGQLAPA